MRKHNYLIGYKGEEQYVFGLQSLQGVMPNRMTTPMTLAQAKKLSKEFSRRHKDKAVIYRLVEVKGE